MLFTKVRWVVEAYHSRLKKFWGNHAPISCCITINPEQRGPNSWKFNNALLLDEEFIIMVKNCINDIKQIYVATPYNPEFIDASSKELELMIKRTLFWETLLVTLRGEIICYSKKKKRIREKEKKQLEKRIEALDNKVTSGRASSEDLTALSQLNNELQSIRKVELKGAYVRSRADWIEHGEKPSKLFLNLENKNRVNKNITEIKLDDDSTVTKQSEILVCLRNFYSDLYKPRKQLPIEEDYEILPNILTHHEKN